MRALTISQPYAELIAAGDKWAENRTWETRYRGELAIHAGKGSQYLTRSELADYTTGAVVAVASLRACVRYERVKTLGRGLSCNQPVSGTSWSWGEVLAHSHAEGPVCFLLADVRRLAEPIPCRGHQSLWTPDSGLQLAIQQALELSG